METALGTVDANQGGPTVVTYSDFSSDVSLGQKILIAGYEYEVAGITTSEIQVVGTLSEGCTHATAYKCRIVEIPAVSTANQVKKVVESLPGVGAVDVIRVGPDNFNCFTWRVTFASFLGSMRSASEGYPCLVVENFVVGSNILLTTDSNVATISASSIAVQPVAPDFGSSATTVNVDAYVKEVQAINIAKTAISGLLKFHVSYGPSLFPQHPGYYRVRYENCS